MNSVNSREFASYVKLMKLLDGVIANDDLPSLKKLIKEHGKEEVLSLFGKEELRRVTLLSYSFGQSKIFLFLTRKNFRGFDHSDHLLLRSLASHDESFRRTSRIYHKSTLNSLCGWYVRNCGIEYCLTSDIKILREYAKERL